MTDKRKLHDALAGIRAILPAENEPAATDWKLVPVEQWEKLRRFAIWRISQNSPCGPDEDDGEDLFDAAVKADMLVPVEASEPCGESCACAEWDDFPQTCYRLAEWVAEPAAPSADLSELRALVDELRIPVANDTAITAARQGCANKLEALIDKIEHSL